MARSPRAGRRAGRPPASGPLPQRATLAVAVVAAASLLGSCAASATAAQTATTPTSSSSIWRAATRPRNAALTSKAAAANSPGPRRSAGGRLVASIAMPSPGSVETAFGSVWVANGPAHTVTRLDPRTNAVIASIPTPDPASVIAVGAGAIWLTSFPGNTLSRIDPVHNRVTRTINSRARRCRPHRRHRLPRLRLGGQPRR